MGRIAIHREERIALILGAASLLFGLHSFAHTRSLLLRGQVAKGMVVVASSAPSATSNGASTTSHRLQIVFKTSSGRTVVLEGNGHAVTLGLECSEAFQGNVRSVRLVGGYQEGERIDVLYDDHDPTRARTLEPAQLWAIPVISSLFGALLMSGVVAVLLAARSYRGRPSPVGKVARAKVAGALLAGEHILWIGRPLPGRHVLVAGRESYLFAAIVNVGWLLWPVLAVAAANPFLNVGALGGGPRSSVQVIDASGLEFTQLLVFLAILAVYGRYLSTAPTRAGRRARKTAYAVTEQRALVLVAGQPIRQVSLSLHDLHVAPSADGCSADVILQDPRDDGMPFALLGVVDYESVEHLIRSRVAAQSVATRDI